MSERRQPKRVTIYTIAERAGVHPSTASRALSPGAHRVSAATTERVTKIAVELGYEPHHWARSLRTNRTYTLGVVLPRLSDGVLARMGEAAEDAAREHGYVAVTLSTHDIRANQKDLVELLLERRVDGLILATPALDDPLLSDLEDRDVPFVLMNRKSGDHPSVAADDELGGFLATRHLLSEEHTRIGVVTGPMEFSTAASRFDGYARALEEAGIELNNRYIAHSSFHMEGGVEAGNALLASQDRPTAVFAVNDSTAIGVMAAARDLGLHVPGDVALVGYNDSETAPMLRPPLTSVGIPLAKMGVLAVDLLVRRIEGDPQESVIVAPRLQVRASSQTRPISSADRGSSFPTSEEPRSSRGEDED